MRIALISMLLGALAGCDPDPPAPPPPPAKKPLPPAVEVTTVTPLPPDRRTHVAPTGDGQVFWVQEADGGGRETVFASTNGGLPSATRFTNATVLEALPGSAGGAGSIQSLAAGADGKLYFYFAGGKGRRTLAAFGSFAPTSGRTQILADAATLARESGMGDSLALARGSVVRAGGTIWLWLRHDDGYSLLATDTGRDPVAAPRRAFERTRGDGPGPRLTAATEDLAAGPGGDLTYLDRRDGRLWRIDPQGGATVLRDLRDLPAGITAPALDDRGRLVMLAPDGRAFNEPPDDLDAPPRAGPVEFPALVILDGDQRTTLGRDAFVMPAKANVKSLAAPQLFRDRSGWLAYRAQTGELIQLRLVPR